MKAVARGYLHYNTISVSTLQQVELEKKAYSKQIIKEAVKVSERLIRIEILRSAIGKTLEVVLCMLDLGMGS